MTYGKVLTGNYLINRLVQQLIVSSRKLIFQCSKKTRFQINNT